MTALCPFIPIMIDSKVLGWPEHFPDAITHKSAKNATARYIELAAALTTDLELDAHTAAYSVHDVHRRLAGPNVYAALEKLEIDGVRMVLLIVDVDAPIKPATAEWWSAERAKLEVMLAEHPDGYVYRTRGGYRIVYVLAEPVVLRSRTDAERWSHLYVAWLDDIEARFGIHGDRACKDWTRLYRLPRVVRDGVKQEPETIGDPTCIGAWSREVVVPAVAERASAANTGDRIPEGGRHTMLLSVAGRMRHDGVPDEAIVAALLATNQVKCDPPLNDDEVRGIASSVTRYPAEIDPVVDAQTQTMFDAKPAPASNPSGYGIDAAEFLGDDESDDEEDFWIVKSLIPEAMPAMIVGPPKSRKSWVELYLAVCIAAGIDAFGLTTKRGRVLVIAREDTVKETRRRLWRIARGLGVTKEQLRGWLLVDATRPLYLDEEPDKRRSKEDRPPTDLEVLQATLKNFKPAIVFVDCMSRVHRSDENSRTEMQPVLNAWADLCSSHSCTVILIHHESKWGDGPVMKRIRGSGDIAAMLRMAIGVSKVNADISKIETDGNLQGMAAEFSVHFADGENDGKKLVTLTTISKEVARAEKGRQIARDLRDEVLAAFHQCSMYESGNAVAKAISRSKGDTARAITQLIEDGTLLRDPDGSISWRRVPLMALPRPSKLLAGLNETP